MGKIFVVSFILIVIFLCIILVNVFDDKSDNISTDNYDSLLNTLHKVPKENKNEVVNLLVQENIVTKEDAKLIINGNVL